MSHRYRSSTVTAVRVVVNKTEVPVSFRWRGRWYEVRAVLACWVEATPWWQALSESGSSRFRSSKAGSNGQAAQREVWRVEAVSRTGAFGVYDLAVVSNEWRLLRVID